MKVKVLAGLAVVVGLSACTALTSSNHRSDSAQLQDVRMRMRTGELVDVKPTNYGTRAVMHEQYPTTSMPANRNTTIVTTKISNPTAGNVPAAPMFDAPRRDDPHVTAGN